MTEHIDQLRQVIHQCVMDEDVPNTADAILTATYPPACQTCRGEGAIQRDTGIWGTVDLFDCPDCPTIAQLLAWGLAVATAEMADKRRPEFFAPAFYDGYNTRLDAIRAVKP